MHVVTVSLFLLFLGSLLYLSFVLTGSWEFLRETYGFVLLVEDATPNIGLSLSPLLLFSPSPPPLPPSLSSPSLLSPSSSPPPPLLLPLSSSLSPPPLPPPPPYLSLQDSFGTTLWRSSAPSNSFSCLRSSFTPSSTSSLSLRV